MKRQSQGRTIPEQYRSPLAALVTKSDDGLLAFPHMGSIQQFLYAKGFSCTGIDDVVRRLMCNVQPPYGPADVLRQCRLALAHVHVEAAEPGEIQRGENSGSVHNEPPGDFDLDTRVVEEDAPNGDGSDDDATNIATDEVLFMHAKGLRGCPEWDDSCEHICA